tara:strand:+ start:2131 stop:2859 length:729 start_codon:yes stop_codon:yes gene_type:complete
MDENKFLDEQKVFYNDYWSNQNPISSYKIQRINRIIDILINDFKSIRKKARLLDFGCGNGAFVSFLNELVSEAHGFDLSDLSIENARIKYPTINYFCGDARNSNLSSNSYEIIISHEIIEHVIPPNLYINECHRLLSKDGYLVITTPNKYYFDRRKGGNYSNQPIENLLTIPKLVKLLNDKFSIEKIETLIMGKSDYGIYRVLHNNLILRLLSKLGLMKVYKTLLFKMKLGLNTIIIAKKIG